MCITSMFRIQRTIFTPIPSQQTYYELDRLVQSLVYRRWLVPLSPAWDEFIPWRDELGALNFLCFPLLLMCTAGYFMGLLAAPFVSCVMLLCCPLLRVSQTDCCIQCSSDYKGDDRPTVYYEVKLQGMAGYPIAYSSLDYATDQVLSYLHAHGVTQDQVYVKDGFTWGEPKPSGCATIPASALTPADVLALQADEQQMQQMAQQQMEMESGRGRGMGQQAGDGVSLVSQHSEPHAYRLSETRS